MLGAGESEFAWGGAYRGVMGGGKGRGDGDRVMYPLISTIFLVLAWIVVLHYCGEKYSIFVLSFDLACLTRTHIDFSRKLRPCPTFLISPHETDLNPDSFSCSRAYPVPDRGGGGVEHTFGICTLDRTSFHASG